MCEHVHILCQAQQQGIFCWQLQLLPARSARSSSSAGPARTVSPCTLSWQDIYSQVAAAVQERVLRDQVADGADTPKYTRAGHRVQVSPAQVCSSLLPHINRKLVKQTVRRVHVHLPTAGSGAAP